MIRRAFVVPGPSIGMLLLCALPLSAPLPAGAAAAGCCQTSSGCFSTDDESECAGGTFYQLGFCKDGRCQPTVADPRPLPTDPKPIQHLASLNASASR